MKNSLRLVRWAVPAALIAGAGCFLANFACGILGVGVAVPQAVASNSNYSIKGDLVDAQGAPLEDVLIHIDHSHVYWDAVMGTATKDESKTVQANRTFDFGWIRGSHVAQKRLRLAAHRND